MISLIDKLGYNTTAEYGGIKSIVLLPVAAVKSRTRMYRNPLTLDLELAEQWLNTVNWDVADTFVINCLPDGCGMKVTQKLEAGKKRLDVSISARFLKTDNNLSAGMLIEQLRSLGRCMAFVQTNEVPKKYLMIGDMHNGCQMLTDQDIPETLGGSPTFNIDISASVQTIESISIPTAYSERFRK